MSSPTKKKTTMAGMKRKAESTKGNSPRSIKKSKAALAQSNVPASKPYLQREDLGDDSSEADSNDEGGAEPVDINDSETGSQTPVKKKKGAAHKDVARCSAGLRSILA